MPSRALPCRSEYPSGPDWDRIYAARPDPRRFESLFQDNCDGSTSMNQALFDA